MLTFDAPSHVYRWEGQPVPSVTQVMEDVGIIDYSHIPEFSRDKWLERGRFVHEATHFDDEGELDEGTLDESLLPYVLAWRKFRQESRLVISLIEHRGYHQKFGYAGTLDRSGTVWVSGGVQADVLLDIKTTSAPEWTRYQTAAYAAFFENPRRFRRLAVELHRDASYRLFEYEGKDWQNDFGIFCAALTTYRVKRQCNKR